MKNQSSSNNKTIMIGIAIVIVLAGVWYFYGGGSGGSSSSSTSQLVSSTPDENPTTAAVGANVLSILNSISSIKIDTAFFSTPVYESLVDYSRPIPSQTVGRPNPFAPIGQ